MQTTIETRPMTDGEYAKERESGTLYFCPKCRSLKVEETDSLEWEDPVDSEETACVRLQCNDCKARWAEILRPVGYEMEGDAL